MSIDSLKRIVRTAIQVIIALATITPLILTVLSGTPAEAKVAIFAGWVTAVTAIINKLEDAFPALAWLKTTDGVPAQVTDGINAAEVIAEQAAAFVTAHPALSKTLKTDLVTFAESIGHADAAGLTKAQLMEMIRDLAAQATSDSEASE